MKQAARPGGGGAGAPGAAPSGAGVPLNAPRASEAAARHPSVKAAAGEIDVTPSAVSHQLRIVEEMFGPKLPR